MPLFNHGLIPAGARKVTTALCDLARVRSRQNAFFFFALGPNSAFIIIVITILYDISTAADPLERRAVCPEICRRWTGIDRGLRLAVSLLGRSGV